MKHSTIALSCIRRLQFLILFAFLAVPASAQVATYYTFSQSAGTYTEINGGTLLTDHTGDMDEEIFSISFPSFRFDGVSYTNAYVSTNGFIVFGGYPATYYYNAISDVDVYAGAIAGFSADLDDAGSGAGPRDLRYEMVGNEAVIQWRNFGRYDVAGERISFQIRLNTLTNEIKIVYGGTITPGSDVTYPEIGLRGPDNTFGTNVNNREVLAGTGAWVNSVPGTSNTSSAYFDSATPTTVPAGGTTFTWTPPAVDVSVTSLSAPANTCHTANETVSVVLRNEGSATIDFSVTPVTISANVTGPNPATFTPVTINTGTLAPHATQTVVVTTGYNMTQHGSYVFNASATVTGDGYAANNAMPPATVESATPSVVASSDVVLCGGQTTTLTATGTAYNYSSLFTNSNVTAIPDDDFIGVNSTIVVSGTSLTASQIGVQINSITHSYVSDLVLTLTAPDGSSIVLSYENGGSGNDYTGTLFTASATNTIASGTAPFTGSFLPDDPFSGLTGPANGTWILNVSDGYEEDAGNLNSWSIVVPVTNSIASYSWGPATGLSSTTVSNPDANPSATTTYTVTVTDIAGCTNTDSVTVTVNPSALTLGIGATDTTVCEGTSVILWGTGASSYSWDNGITDSTAFAPTATTLYTVTGTDGGGCSATASVTVTVYSLPVASATNTGPYCAGETIQLNANGGSTYSWTGPSFTSATQNPAISSSTTANAGVYGVTVTDANGCQNSTFTTVTVNSLPSVSFDFSTDSVCATYGSITLSGGTPAGGVYSGTGVSGTTFDPSTGLGNHVITYTYSDANGCENTDTENMLVSACLGMEETPVTTANIYPNPNAGNFYIQLENAPEESFVVIYNTAGQRMYSQKLQGDILNVDLNVPAGMYIVEISGGSNTSRKPVIIR